MYQIKTSKFIGKRIKDRRRSLRITQEWLAEKMDVTYQQVQRYENGSNRLNVEQIQKIALILDAPLSYFFDEDDNYVKEKTDEDTYSQEVHNEDRNITGYLRMIKNKRYKRLYLEFIRLILKAEANSR